MLCLELEVTFLFSSFRVLVRKQPESFGEVPPCGKHQTLPAAGGPPECAPCSDEGMAQQNLTESDFEAMI